RKSASRCGMSDADTKIVRTRHAELVVGVTSLGDAVVPAQTTPMRAIAAKHGRGSGGFSRGGPNASRWSPKSRRALLPRRFSFERKYSRERESPEASIRLITDGAQGTFRSFFGKPRFPTPGP